MDEAMFEKIGQYLSNELSNEERLNFESDLAINKELASMLNLYKAIESEMRNKEKHDEDEASLKNSLKELNSIYVTNKEKINKNDPEVTAEMPLSPISREFTEKNNKVKSIKTWKIIAVAAGISGVIFLGVTWYLSNSKNNPSIIVDDKKTDSSKKIHQSDTIHLQENIPSQNLAEENKKETKPAQTTPKLTRAEQELLFANNFKPDTIPENTEGPLEDAFAYYESGDFKNAIGAIEDADLNMVTRGQETDVKHIIFYAHYFKALSYMQDGNVLKAIPELKKAAAESPDSSLQIKAQWYLALAYMKTGDVKKAEDLLQHISRNSKDIEYKSKAKMILEKERNLKISGDH